MSGFSRGRRGDWILSLALFFFLLKKKKHIFRRVDCWRKERMSSRQVKALLIDTQYRSSHPGRHGGAAVSVVAPQREGHKFDPGPGEFFSGSLWVCVGSLQVLRLSPTGQSHVRGKDWELKFGRWCALMSGNCCLSFYVALGKGSSSPTKLIYRLNSSHESIWWRAHGKQLEPWGPLKEATNWPPNCCSWTWTLLVQGTALAWRGHQFIPNSQKNPTLFTVRKDSFCSFSF